MENEQGVPPASGTPGYYGVPVLKRPHWKWEIVLYFWVGGIAAGAYLLSAIADLFGDDADRVVVRTGRFIALPLLMLSPLLLIKDLGRPEKFLNMLRVFKLKSPMSVGSWGLFALGGLTGLATLLELCPVRWRLRELSRLLAFLGAPFGLFVGGYTGVLLSATAIPLWSKNRLLWGPTFLASAFSTGVSAITLALALSGRAPRSTTTKLARAHRIGLVTETGLLAASLVNLGPAGRPITTGRWSSLFLPGAVGLGVALPLVLDLRSRSSEPGRALTLATSLAVLLGGLAFRASVVYAGKDSADDAQAYFAMTKR